MAGKHFVWTNSWVWWIVEHFLTLYQRKIAAFYCLLPMGDYAAIKKSKLFVSNI